MIAHYPPAHIKRKCPHEGPHFDEALESVLPDRWGGKHLTGTFSAKIVPKKMHCSEEECLKKGDLLLGQGQKLFDDKGPDGKRLPDTCCAFRMAEYLGISRMEALHKLFKAAKRVDGSKTATDFDVSKLMKDAIASLPKEKQHEAFRWLEIGINAVIDYLLLCHKEKAAGRKVVCNDYVKPRVVLDAMFKANRIDPRIINRMRNLADATVNRVDSCVELAAVSQAMKATGRSDLDAAEWIEYGLRHSAIQQVCYLDALKEVREKGLVVDIDPRFEGDELKMVYIESDNPQIAKASRAPGLEYAVCIVKRSKGNIAILQNSFYHLDMGAVDALVRITEIPEAERKNAAFEEYSRPGTVSQAPHLYVMDDGNIYNGTDNIEAVRIADLSKDDAINIVKCGFTENAVRWFNCVRESDGTLSASETAYLEKVRSKYVQAKFDIKKARDRRTGVVTTEETPTLSGDSRRELEEALDRK